MTPTVEDMVRLMARIAPGGLAESWDNVGLQIGDPRWPVSTVWLALDPLPEVVTAACREDVHLLITHHPLIFKPLSRVDFSAGLGRIIDQSARHRLAVFSAHTNLDSAVGGLNDVAADLCEIREPRLLVPAAGDETVKLVVFVPEGHEDAIGAAVKDSPAGRIGPYTGCTFRSPGVGSFTPAAHARPYSGEPGVPSQVSELRFEVLVPKRNLDEVVARIINVHPYETPAYDVYPLVPPPAAAGLGRVGRIAAPQRLDDYAAALAVRFGSTGVRVVGDADMQVRTVAVCTGSGGSLLGDFFKSGADVFVTGDIRYHDARDIEAAGKALIDLGHFSSEMIFARPLAERLRQAAGELGFDVAITPCQLERDPFRFVSASGAA